MEIESPHTAAHGRAWPLPSGRMHGKLDGGGRAVYYYSSRRTPGGGIGSSVRPHSQYMDVLRQELIATSS